MFMHIASTFMVYNKSINKGGRNRTLHLLAVPAGNRTSVLANAETYPDTTDRPTDDTAHALATYTGSFLEVCETGALATLQRRFFAAAIAFR
jgi:hypothetical protein